MRLPSCSSRFPRRAGALALGACLAAFVGCLDPAGLTDGPDDGGALPADTLAPTVQVLGGPAGALALEVGDSLAVALHDTGVVRRVVVLLVDSLARIHWRSDTLRVATRRDTLRVPLLAVPDTFAFESALHAIAWAADSSGNARYSGAPDSAALTRRLASGPRATVTRGRTIPMAGASAVSTVAYDADRRVAYLADSVENTVSAVTLDDLTPSAWRLRVGSRPTRLALRTVPTGVLGYTLNAGGTELSVLDLPATGTPRELARHVLPIHVVDLGARGQYRPAFPAQAMFVYCPDAGCPLPYLAVSSRAAQIPDDSGTVASDSASIIRLFDLTAADPMRQVELVAPRHGVIPRDSLIDARLLAIDRTSLATDTLGIYPSASLCATAGVGSAMVTTSSDAGGPLFVGDGGGQRLCGTVTDGALGRLLRVERTYGEARISAVAALATQSDGRLRDATLIATNADGSRVALVNGAQVLITDGTLRLLGSIDVGAPVTAVAFKANTRVSAGDATWLVAATATQLALLDGDAFRVAERLTPRAAVTGPLLFAATRTGDGVLLGGPLASKRGTWFVTRPLLPAGAARRR